MFTILSSRAAVLVGVALLAASVADGAGPGAHPGPNRTHRLAHLEDLARRAAEAETGHLYRDFEVGVWRLERRLAEPRGENRLATVELAAEADRLESLHAALADGRRSLVRRASADGGRLEGVITGADGQPLADVQVVVYDSGYGFAGLALTDHGGGYRVAGLAAGRYSVRVRANGWLDVALGEAPCASSCERVGAAIRVRPQRTSVSHLALRSGMPVSGTVTDAGTGGPLPGLKIYVTAGFAFAGQAITGVDGSFTITGLGAGTHYFEVAASDYVAEAYDDVVCVGCPGYLHGDPVELVTGEPPPSIDFALERGGRVVGTVVDEATGEPLADAVMFFENGQSVRTSASTDANGQYRSRALPDGSYTVGTTGAFRAGYFPEGYDDVRCPYNWGNCDPAELTPVSIAGQGTVTIDVALALGATISGSVTAEETGAPLGGVVVVSSGGLGGVQAVIASDGTFRITGLETGDYYVYTGNTDGYFDELWQDVEYSYGMDLTLGDPVSATEREVTGGVDLVLSSAAAIEGTLTEDGSGDPIAFGYLRAYDGTRWYTARADAAGHFRFDRLPPGTYYVQTTLGELGPWINEIYDDLQCRSCPIEDGTPIEVTGTATVSGIDIGVERAAQISGRVTSEETGLPLADAWVQAVGGGGIASTTTGADGTYTITPISTGTYSVRAGNTDHVARLYQGGYCSYFGCPFAAGGHVSVLDQAGLSGIDLELAAGGVVSGLVTAVADGSSLSGVVLWLYDEHGFALEGAVSGANGSFRIPPVANGPTFFLAVAAAPQGYIREIWADRPAFYFPPDQPTLEVLRGQPISFASPGEQVLVIDLDSPETALTLSMTVIPLEPGAGGTVRDDFVLACSSSCALDIYAQGVTVTLEATPDPGSQFVSWGGDADCLDGVLTMTLDIGCTASFRLEPPLFGDGFESGDLSAWAPW